MQKIDQLASTIFVGIDDVVPTKAQVDTSVTLSCTIRGLSGLVNVSWSNSDGSELKGE
jgi:hypothetical protein